MSHPHPDPVSRRQAREILANPARWADRPSLIQLARWVAASAEGLVVTQRRLAARRAAPGRAIPRAPHLRLINGGLSETDPLSAHRDSDLPRGSNGGLS